MHCSLLPLGRSDTAFSQQRRGRFDASKFGVAPNSRRSAIPRAADGESGGGDRRRRRRASDESREESHSRLRLFSASASSFALSFESSGAGQGNALELEAWGWRGSFVRLMIPRTKAQSSSAVVDAAAARSFQVRSLCRWPCSALFCASAQTLARERAARDQIRIKPSRSAKREKTSTYLHKRKEIKSEEGVCSTSTLYFFSRFPLSFSRFSYTSFSLSTARASLPFCR